MKRVTSLLWSMALGAALVACDKAPEPEPKATEAPTAMPDPVAEAPAPEPSEPEVDLEPARKAAAIANKIEKAPADAEKILEDEGLSEDTFIAELYTIAEDPALSAEYARLYEPADSAG